MRGFVTVHSVDEAVHAAFLLARCGSIPWLRGFAMDDALSRAVQREANALTRMNEGWRDAIARAYVDAGLPAPLGRPVEAVSPYISLEEATTRMKRATDGVLVVWKFNGMPTEFFEAMVKVRDNKALPITLFVTPECSMVRPHDCGQSCSWRAALDESAQERIGILGGGVVEIISGVVIPGGLL